MNDGWFNEDDDVYSNDDNSQDSVANDFQEDHNRQSRFQSHGNLAVSAKITDKDAESLRVSWVRPRNQILTASAISSRVRFSFGQNKSLSANDQSFLLPS